MDRLIDWLPAHIPPATRPGLDRARRLPPRQPDLPSDRAARPRGARLGAVDARPSAGRLPYHCMTWHIPPGAFRGIGGLDLAALGIPTEARVRRALLRAHRPRDAMRAADWDFYLAYNMFRLAAILQGIAKRARRRHRGERAGAGGRRRRRPPAGRAGLAARRRNAADAHVTRHSMEHTHGLRLLRPRSSDLQERRQRLHGRARLSRPRQRYCSRARGQPRGRQALGAARSDRGAEAEGARRGAVEPVPARERARRRA